MARNLSPEDAKRKKAIFNSMSPRRQKHILKKEGYDEWDPFMEPKDPIDMRKDKTKRTAIQLAREFLASCDQKDYSNAYGQGVWEICLGIINDDDRARGMYEFSCWYKSLLKNQGQE
jgi:hypothetical protein